MELSTIHSTAVIHPGAALHKSVKVGPYAVIDPGVVIGSDCNVGPHVHLTGQTIIGTNNEFHAGSVIGDAPQDLKYKGQQSQLRIGDENIFREHVTIHRSNTSDEETIIGSGNFFMAHSHVGHNSLVGDNNTFANGALIAGHVEIANRAFIAGNCLVHQFVRIGTLALMQGGAAISKDLPPYTVAVHGLNEICGLNTVGLRRAGYTSEQRQTLKGLYRELFLGGKNITEAVKEALNDSPDKQARDMLEFIVMSKRGVCRHTRRKGTDPLAFQRDNDLAD